MEDRFNRKLKRAAQRLSYDRKVSDPLFRAAAVVYLNHAYADLLEEQLPLRRSEYVAPHVPGNPGSSRVSGNGG